MKCHTHFRFPTFKFKSKSNNILTGLDDILAACVDALDDLDLCRDALPSPPARMDATTDRMRGKERN